MEKRDGQINSTSSKETRRTDLKNRYFINLSALRIFENYFSTEGVFMT